MGPQQRNDFQHSKYRSPLCYSPSICEALLFAPSFHRIGREASVALSLWDQPIISATTEYTTCQTSLTSSKFVVYAVGDERTSMFYFEIVQPEPK